jgi:hypothetical protein
MKSKLFPEELQKTPDTKEVTLEKATEELVKPGKAGENPGLE